MKKRKIFGLFLATALTAASSVMAYAGTIPFHVTLYQDSSQNDAYSYREPKDDNDQKAYMTITYYEAFLSAASYAQSQDRTRGIVSDTFTFSIYDSGGPTLSEQYQGRAYAGDSCCLYVWTSGSMSGHNYIEGRYCP